MADCQASGDDGRAHVLYVSFERLSHDIEGCFVDFLQQKSERVVLTLYSVRTLQFHRHLSVVCAGLIRFLDAIDQNSRDGDPGCALFSLFVVVVPLLFSGSLSSVLCHHGFFFNSKKVEFSVFFIFGRLTIMVGAANAISGCDGRNHSSRGLE